MVCVVVSVCVFWFRVLALGCGVFSFFVFEVSGLRFRVQGVMA